MRTVSASIFILCLFLTVSAQERMTDREFDGFKGDVKTVSIETMPLTDPRLKNKRVVWEKWTYNFAGMKMEENNPQGKSKVVFRYADGVKIGETISQEGGRRETFTNRYVYEYDARGRVKTERVYFNKNRPPIVRNFRYDANGRLTEKTEDSPTSFTRTTFKYDARGNLSEKLDEQKGKGEYSGDSKTRTVYSGYKIDAYGNWTERKTTVYYEGEPKPYISMDYQVITYF